MYGKGKAREVMCEVLDETTLDGAAKTSEWLMNSNFAANCSDQTSTYSEELPVKMSVVKVRRSSTKFVKASLSGSSRHHGRKHKSKHDHVAGNFERFNNTVEVLLRSGLLEITHSISRLVKENENLQTEIDKLQQETKEHSKLLQRQLQKKLEAENEAKGSSNPEGRKLLTRLSQSLLQ